MSLNIGMQWERLSHWRLAYKSFKALSRACDLKMNIDEELDMYMSVEAPSKWAGDMAIPERVATVSPLLTFFPKFLNRSSHTPEDGATVQPRYVFSRPPPTTSESA